MSEAKDEGDSEENDSERRYNGVANSESRDGYDAVAKNNVVRKNTLCNQFRRFQADGSCQLRELAHHLSERTPVQTGSRHRG
jgi:hypothetical protein